MWWSAVALSKFPKPGIRPRAICIGNAWSRLLGRGLLTECNKESVDFLQNSLPNEVPLIGGKDLQLINCRSYRLAC